MKYGQAGLKSALATKVDIAAVTAGTLDALEVVLPFDGGQILDLIVTKGPVDAQTLASALRPLQPRLYSISSSPNAHPGEVHLTVGEVHYDLQDPACKGLASTHLGQRLPVRWMLGVYVQRSPHFHPPADDTRPLIMIGPGTGIAPFRAFLEEREARRATGKNWLFFGDQHEALDYLYRDQIDTWHAGGFLTKLSLAWKVFYLTMVSVQAIVFAVMTMPEEYRRFVESEDKVSAKDFLSA